MKSLIRWILALIVLWLVSEMSSQAYPVHATEGLVHQYRMGQDAPSMDRILFTSNEFSAYGLFMMAADGSGRRPLTETLGFDDSATFSPDGQWIAFVSQRDDDHNGLVGRPNFEVYVMRPDGSDLRRLTDDPAWDSDPTWAPDSQTVYFASDRNGDYGIYRVDVDEGTIEPVTARGSNYLYPDISSDGSQMLFVATRGPNSEIYVLDLATMAERQLTTSALEKYAPRWSPDDSQIVFAAEVHKDEFDTDVYVMNADGSNVRQLTDDPNSDDWPSWSPDGTRIAFTSLRDWTGDTDYVNGAEIYVMNADGTDVVRLTNNIFQDTLPEWFPNATVSLVPPPTDLQFPGLSANMPQGQAATYYEEGMALAEKGDYEKAIDVFSLAIAFQPNSEVIYIGRAMAYFNLGDYEAAIADASQAITLNRFVLGGYWIRGLAYLETERWASAVSDGSQIVEQWPDYYFGYELLARVYYHLGNYEAARTNLELYFEHDGPATDVMTALKADVDELMALGPTPTPTAPPPTTMPDLIPVTDTEAAFAVGTVLTVPGPAPLTLRTIPAGSGGVSTFCLTGQAMTVLRTVAIPDGTHWVELDCESATGWLDEALLQKFFQ